VRYHQIKAGYPDPFKGALLPRLDYVMKGVKRHQAKTGEKARTRLPITPSLLRRLKSVWARTGRERDTKLMWAASCLCFFGFLRTGEMTVPSDGGYNPQTHLNLSDIALDDNRRPSLVRVSIKQSKQIRSVKGSTFSWVARLPIYARCRHFWTIFR
jgi:hypothetical protein